MFKKIISFILIVAIVLPYIPQSTFAATNNKNKDFIMITAGDSFFIALKKDGTVWSWGHNDYGQLGDGTGMDRTEPVQVKGLTDIIAVSAGGEHALAIQRDGTIWGWGHDVSYSINGNERRGNNLPVLVERIEGAVAVQAGNYHSVVLKEDGTLWSWGYRIRGMLQVPEMTGVKSMATTELVTYAVKEDGSVWNWGLNRRASEADGSDAFTTPVQVKGLSDIVMISTTSSHVLALKKDGTVWARGENYKGQLGDGTEENRENPVKVKKLTDVVAISAGESHSLAMKKDGTVWAWGSNDDGQIGVPVSSKYLGIGESELIHYSTPMQVKLNGVNTIAAGEEQSFAILKGGEVWGWGQNLNGVNPVTEAQSYVIDPKFESGGSFSDHVVYTGRATFVDRTGKKVADWPYDRYCGQMYSFSEGVAAICIPSESGWGRGSLGLMDKTGTVIVKPQYESIGEFVDGLASIYKNGKWGFIDQTGKEVIEPQYDAYGYGYEFSEGLLMAYKDGKFGYVDKSGKVVIPFIYDYARNFSEGLAVVSKNDKYGFINKAGKEVIKPKYEDAFPFGDGVAIVQTTNSWLLVNTAGKESKLNWNSFQGPHDTFADGLLKVERNGKHGFINKKGQEVIKVQYSYIDNFNDGLAVAAKVDSNYGSKYGFMDKKGKEIIPLQYDQALQFSEGLAAVKHQGKWGFIDKKGKLVIKYLFDDVKSFSEGLAAVKVNDKWGYISNPLDIPANWAVEELTQARNDAIIPITLDYGYSQNITRSDFSQLAVHLLTKVNAKTIEELLHEQGKSIKIGTFSDTSDHAVLAAYELGIVSGKGNGLFDPSGHITRQEAAVMLTNVAKLLGVKKGNEIAFNDQADIASWAKGAVAYVSTLKDSMNQTAVMGGTGDNKFSPRGNFTRQQAMVTMKRMFNALEE